MNPNYSVIVKQNIDKLLVASLIQLVEEVTWLSSIAVVPKKNGKLQICIYFLKLNVTMKKGSYPPPFIDKILNIVA
jgi:hypothetical protein